VVGDRGVAGAVQRERIPGDESPGLSGSGVEIRRLGPRDRELARATFRLMADVFGERPATLSDVYLDGLLARLDFWVIAAIVGNVPVGGLTAHTLPMTAYEGAEIFLYDIAVAVHQQRRGFGRRLIDALRREAAALSIATIFVPAEDEDAHALDFYRAIGGRPTRVTLFEFGPSPSA
jgi:aminoglycoside 3-N-acetyltransferase I